jgi:hypothetical protein
MSIIQGNKILVGLGLIPIHDQRLHNQQPAILVMRVADGRDNRPNDFA